METISDMLKRHEGFRSKPYLDTVGVPTFGYGFTYILLDEAEEILGNRISELHRACAARWDWFDGLEDPRKNVILDMAYCMGVEGVANFGRMIAAIEEKCWADAAAEIMDSHFGRTHKNRANELAGMMMLPGE